LFVALLVQPWQAAHAQWLEFFNLDRPYAFMVGAHETDAIMRSAQDSFYWSQDYGQHFEALPLEGVSVEEASLCAWPTKARCPPNDCSKPPNKGDGTAGVKYARPSPTTRKPE
jgi:hypothetical protein